MASSALWLKAYRGGGKPGAKPAGFSLPQPHLGSNKCDRAVNIAAAFELGGQVVILSEPRCTGQKLALEAKKYGCVSTDPKGQEELLAAIAYDPKIGQE